MKNPIMVPELRDLLKKRRHNILREFVEEHHEREIAEYLGLLRPVVWSTVFGSVIPIVAVKMKLDPAVISSPTLATLVDMGGITVYFTIARLVLGI